MKRILTLLFLGAMFMQTQAQVLFSQDFESATIAPMKAVDVDGRTIHPNVASFCGPTWTIVGNAENRQVVSTSWFNPVGVADDWLISPAVEITQANTFLVWQAYSPDANYRDGYEVRISTTDDEVASFTTIALTVPAELTTPNIRALRLDDYVGTTIHFAFRNNSNDKFLLYMDNISVQVFKSNDVVLRSVNVEKYNPADTDIPVRVNIQNYGGDQLTTLVFTWSLGEESHTDTLSNINLNTLVTRELTHSVRFNPGAAGEYTINVSVTEPNGVEDEAPEDNGGSRKLYTLAEQLPKKVVVEEATGTWCGWCPRGTVAMDIIGSQHAAVAIPIAVHNSDPMAIAEYDTPFGGTIGGYPSGHVDRKQVDIDPSTFVAALNGLRNRRVPVQVLTESVFNEDTRTATIKGTASLSIPTEANDLRFVCVVTESDVRGTGTAWNQVNFYAGGGNGPMGGYENLPDPVPANQMKYDFVARALLGGFDGLENSIPDAVEANETFEIEFSYVVPQAYNVENMKAIIFVLDEETGEILNGDIVDLGQTTVSVPLVPTGKTSLYPNPATETINLTVDYQTDAPVNVRIYTTYGQLVRDLGLLNLSSGSASERINIADLQSGMYLLELRHKNAVTGLPFTKL